MRRSRRKRIPANVSLFPFLAVLICTLGVLIVMLVIATKQADTEASQKREAVSQEEQQQLDQLQDQYESAEMRIEGISRARNRVFARLQDSRNNRSHLRQEVRKIRQQLLAARQEFVTASERLQAGLPTTVNPDPVDLAELAELRDKIELAKQTLAEERAEVDQAGPNRYVIVPYKGEGGTFRRPIFIECTKDELRLQPLGIVLRKSEFDLPLPTGNMLDAALLTIREYWQRYDLDGEQGSPYPLLVVRPDGAETFVLARRAMKSWDDEFGYELVERNKAIEFGKRDDALAKEVAVAIEAARVRQQMFAQQIRQKQALQSAMASRSSRKRLSAARRGGGFSQVHDQGESDSLWGDNMDGAQALRELKRQVSGAATDRKSRGRGRQSGDGTGEGASDRQLAQASLIPPMTPTTNTQAARYSESPNAGMGQLPVQAAGSNQSAGPSANAAQSGDGANSAAQAKGGAGAQGQGQAGSGSPFADLSIARKKGADWALPTRTPGSVGYLRPIRVICHRDRLELSTVAGQRLVIPFSNTFPADQVSEQAVNKLVEEVWRQIESWGIAGTGNYWKPQLRVTVKPGARQQFQQLQGLLYQSGLALGESTRQPAGGTR